MRVGVIASLRAADRPSTVHDLLSRLPEGTDAVTVYRTLKTLMDHKLVRRLRGEDRSWLFESAETGTQQTHYHPHFVCDTCGTVECLPETAVQKRTASFPKLARGYEVTTEEITLHGVCPKCH